MKRTIHLLIQLVACVQATALCFYPDGITTEPGHIPCNQTSTAASACCDPLDSCAQSGFCLGRSGWVYRGSCTDKTWESDNCARSQETCLIDTQTNLLHHSFTPVASCVAEGTIGHSYCCLPESGAPCCNNSFTSFDTGAAFMPGFDQLVFNITQAAQQNATLAAQQSVNNSSGNLTASMPSTNNTGNNNNNNNVNLGTKIGLGVGIPLGVLVLGLLVLLFYRESANRTPNYPTYDARSAEMHFALKTYGSSGYTVHEAPTGNGVHEMRA